MYGSSNGPIFGPKMTKSTDPKTVKKRSLFSHFLDPKKMVISPFSFNRFLRSGLRKGVKKGVQKMTTLITCDYRQLTPVCPKKGSKNDQKRVKKRSKKGQKRVIIYGIPWISCYTMYIYYVIKPNQAVNGSRNGPIFGPKRVIISVIMRVIPWISCSYTLYTTYLRGYS